MNTATKIVGEYIYIEREIEKGESLTWSFSVTDHEDPSLRFSNKVVTCSVKLL